MKGQCSLEGHFSGYVVSSYLNVTLTSLTFLDKCGTNSNPFNTMQLLIYFSHDRLILLNEQ